MQNVQEDEYNESTLRMKTICRKDGKDGTDAMIGKDTMSFVHVHFGWATAAVK